ncbi:MAG: hydroxyacid dehydrogenase [Oscillospiraceae bacterium]|nr:hydroxyacid dehydrogenase [Oscillospiraceae bacterium]
MTVYLSEYIHPEAAAMLREKAAVVDSFDRPEKIDAIILRNIPVTAGLMDKCKNLKVIGKHGVGVNTIDVDAARERGIQVINTPTANADAVAEMTVALFLALERKLYEANVNCRKGIYTAIAPHTLIGTEIGGKTLGQIGMGNIAQRIAKILREGFGCRILGYDPFVSPEDAAARGFEKVEKLEELLECSDLVNVNVPLVKSTEGLISGEMFNHFKPDAVFVNAARGAIISEDDLYDALVSGKLKAAACDTFLIEPPTAANKLLSLENFSATPHIGGNTEEALYRTGMEIVTETLNVLDGKQPLHPVH